MQYDGRVQGWPGARLNLRLLRMAQVIPVSRIAPKATKQVVADLYYLLMSVKHITPSSLTRALAYGDRVVGTKLAVDVGCDSLVTADCRYTQLPGQTIWDVFGAVGGACRDRVFSSQ